MDGGETWFMRDVTCVLTDLYFQRRNVMSV